MKSVSRKKAFFACPLYLQRIDEINTLCPPSCPSERFAAWSSRKFRRAYQLRFKIALAVFFRNTIVHGIATWKWTNGPCNCLVNILEGITPFPRGENYNRDADEMRVSRTNVRFIISRDDHVASIGFRRAFYVITFDTLRRQRLSL